MFSHKNKEDTSVVYLRRWTLRTFNGDLLHADTLFMNRWEITSKIGHGAHGEVYSAFDRTRQSNVAVKVITDMEAFRQETRIMQNLCHLQNFAYYITHDEKEEIPYLITELQGENLKTITFCYKPCSLTTIMKCGLQMFEALEALHKMCYVHCDVKAANFVIGMPPKHSNKVYLIDFSLAEEFDPSIKSESENQIHSDNSVSLFGFSSRKSRRQDLLGLIYLMLDMGVETPWYFEKNQLIKQGYRHKYGDILIKKHLGPEIVVLKDLLEKMKIFEQPDYSKLKSYMYKLIRNNDIDLSSKMDWEINPERVWKLGTIKTDKNIMQVLKRLNDVQYNVEQTVQPLLSHTCDILHVTSSKLHLYPQRPHITEIRKIAERIPSESQKTLSPYFFGSINPLMMTQLRITQNGFTKLEMHKEPKHIRNLSHHFDPSVEPVEMIRPADFRNMAKYNKIISYYGFGKSLSQPHPSALKKYSYEVKVLYKSTPDDAGSSDSEI